LKIEITSQRRNELLKRKEVTFLIDHKGSGTPTRLETRQKLAGMLNADVDKVYVSKFETKKGSMTAIGHANLYDSVDQARHTEPEHIVLRNTRQEKKKE